MENGPKHLFQSTRMKMVGVKKYEYDGERKETIKCGSCKWRHLTGRPIVSRYLHSEAEGRRLGLTSPGTSRRFHSPLLSP